MIQLEGVRRIYPMGSVQISALLEIDLAIQSGEYLSIMGPSGSGKSTLLNILGLLDRPTTGRYLLEGVDTGLLADNALAGLRRERIGFVFQFFHLIPRLTAFENIALPLLLSGMHPLQRREKVESLLSAFGLSDRGHHRPDELSGGQRQRVAIARAVVTEPGMILADEPTGNLDRASGEEVVALLEELNHRGVTLIVVTHDPELGGRAPRQVRMQDGRILEDRRRKP